MEYFHNTPLRYVYALLRSLGFHLFPRWVYCANNPYSVNLLMYKTMTIDNNKNNEQNEFARHYP